MEIHEADEIEEKVESESIDSKNNHYTNESHMIEAVVR